MTVATRNNLPGRPSTRLSDLGRHALTFDDDEVVQLLRAAVEREGSQVAFAGRHGLDRVHLNMILKGKRSVTEKITKTLGLRKVYVADSFGCKAAH